MKLLEPNAKNSVIVSLFIFAQKIYRHPNDFSFIFNEGLTTFILGILGMLILFGSVCAFVLLGLFALNTIIEKIRVTHIYKEYGYYILDLYFFQLSLMF